MNLFEYIKNLFKNKNPDFIITYKIGDLYPTFICPKCGSDKCIENDEYWSITHICFNCGYKKDLN